MKRKSFICTWCLKMTGFFLLSVALISCFENPSAPSITTVEITAYTNTTATSGGEINSDGGSEIFQKGVCWSTAPNPTLRDAHTIDGSGAGNFESEITALSEATTYYIRAYAVNSAGIGYGNEITFSSVGITIGPVENITGYSASLQGNVSSDKSITERGFCWNTSTNPTISNNTIIAGTGTGVFNSNISGLVPGTTYYVRAYAEGPSGIFYSDNTQFTTLNFPTVTTKAITNEGTFIPTTGGDLLANGGSIIINQGVCWSTNPLPTVADNKTEDVTIQSSEDPNPYFISHPYVLEPGTMYYLRAYATNGVGTSYGNQFTITMPDADVLDADGNPYSAVTIGTQVWTVENLRTTKYANGETIENITDPTAWRNASGPAWSYYENVEAFDHPYGKLYNWFAVTDARKLCPNGWHAPSQAEWNTLIDFLGGSNVAGGKLKETGNAHWDGPDNQATNSSGFTALPGGGKSATFASYPSGFMGLFWSTTAINTESAQGYYLVYFNTIIATPPLPDYLKQAGHSVRCIKD